jgi:hypothetical protein
MFFFGIKYLGFGANESKARLEENNAFLAQDEMSLPSRKPLCIMHPENAPRMIHDRGFSKDFALYGYAGATLELLSARDAEGRMIRRPALVAKMVRKYDVVEEGAVAQMEMTASLRDLRRGNHPHARAIAAALNTYYEEKVSNKERVAKARKEVAVTTASQFPANDFFTKMNASAAQPAWAR